MARIFAVSNQKGGVGKTTTAVNLAACLAAAERKTLLIDLDPQSNATSGVGISPAAVEHSVYHVLIGAKKISEIAQPTELDDLQVVPANQDLIGAEVELVSQPGREYILKEALSEIDNAYEFVVLDCPPSLSLVTLNALTASHSVIIPMQCEYFAMEGLGQLFRTTNLVRQRLNPELEIEGVCLTMYDKRNNLCHEVALEIRSKLDELVFETVIPRNVKLGECPSFGKPIILYDIHSRGAVSYLKLAREILLRTKEKRKSLNQLNPEEQLESQTASIQ